MFKLNISRFPAVMRCPNLHIRPCTTTPQAADDEKQKAIDDEKQKELDRIAKNASIDEPPTSCCQSGCTNCVFIVWAEALSAKMLNAGPEVAEKILKTVEDPNMKAYLEMELRIRGLKKD